MRSTSISVNFSRAGRRPAKSDHRRRDEEQRRDDRVALEKAHIAGELVGHRALRSSGCRTIKRDRRAGSSRAGRATGARQPPQRFSQARIAADGRRFAAVSDECDGFAVHGIRDRTRRMLERDDDARRPPDRQEKDLAVADGFRRPTTPSRGRRARADAGSCRRRDCVRPPSGRAADSTLRTRSRDSTSVSVESAAVGDCAASCIAPSTHRRAPASTPLSDDRSSQRSHIAYLSTTTALNRSARAHSLRNDSVGSTSVARRAGMNALNAGHSRT